MHTKENPTCLIHIYVICIKSYICIHIHIYIHIYIDAYTYTQSYICIHTVYVQMSTEARRVHLILGN